MKQRLLLTLLAFATFASSSPAKATYPDHPLRLIVPQTAGGPSDTLGRQIAQGLSQELNQHVIVENKGGAGGNVGADLVAKSPPDGYTLVISIASVLAINEALYKVMPFDAAEDLQGVGTVASSQMVLVANPAFPVASVRELIEHVKSKPAGTVPYGSAGTGSPMHVGGELLNKAAGIKLNHIPYKGAAPALNDVLGNHIPLAIVGLPAAVPHIKEGRLNAIAIFGGLRSALAPDLPTFVEAGYPEVQTELIYGIFVPRGTPTPIVSRLNTALNLTLSSHSLKEILLRMNFEAQPSSPAELDAYLKQEVTRWKPIVRESGATAN